MRRTRQGCPPSTGSQLYRTSGRTAVRVAAAAQGEERRCRREEACNNSLKLFNDHLRYYTSTMTSVVVLNLAGGKASRGRAESPRLHATATPTQPVVSPVKRATTRTVPQHEGQEYHPADVPVAQAVTGEAGIS